MADKGFTISELPEPFGVGRPKFPPVLDLRSQQTLTIVITTQKIVSAERIHIESAINKVKNIHIFNQVIPLVGSQMWTVFLVLS